MGKGRTIAGLMLENWRCGRKRHLWISIGSDLKVDARRDLDDVGATDMLVHALNKQPYAALDSDKVSLNLRRLGLLADIRLRQRRCNSCLFACQQAAIWTMAAST